MSNLPTMTTLDGKVNIDGCDLEGDHGASVTAETTETQPTFHLSLFQTLGKAQSAHGIPLLDYAQYHAYCTKRLHRIRHHRDVRNRLVHNFKYRKQAPSQGSLDAGGGGGKKGRSRVPVGGRHAFCPQQSIPPDGIIPHEYILWHLVFQAERAWAMACSLQSSSNNNSANSGSIINTASNNKNKKAKTKSHIISRLNKAVHWARNLEDAVVQRACATPVTQREVQSYLMWMLGNQQLQREEYAAAFRFFSSSRNILLELAAMPSTNESTENELKNSTGPTSGVDAEHVALQDMWTNRADNLLLPLIRYCQYEAKDEDLALSEEEAHQSSSTASKKKSNAIALEFRNRIIALDSYPQLVVLYLKLEKHLIGPSTVDNDDESRTPMSESDFLQYLSDLDDALRLSIQELQRFNDLPDGPAVEAKRKELSTLKAFFQYHKLSLQRQHQEERLEDTNVFTADAAEMLHVYDALLQNVQAMADLNQDDDSNYNPEDDPCWLQAQTHVIRIRALRCFQLARLYESPVWLAGTTTGQVLALLQQCSRLQRRAMEEVAACDYANSADEVIYQRQLKKLKIHVQAMIARTSAVKFLEQRESESSSDQNTALSKATNRPLWLRLRDLDAGPVLADQDPSPILMPIPCKPVFYDVAWEHVTDSLASTQVLDECIAMHEPKKKAGGGFLNWFSS